LNTSSYSLPVSYTLIRNRAGTGPYFVHALFPGVQALNYRYAAVWRGSVCPCSCLNNGQKCRGDGRMCGSLCRRECSPPRPDPVVAQVQGQVSPAGMITEGLLGRCLHDETR
jgi:hypothetical protein